MKVISSRTNYLMLGAVVLLVLIPLVFVHGTFGGSDDAGSAAIEALRPGFKPWFHPLWEPPGSEIESLLFAVQAAFGASIIGYVIGRIHGAAQARDERKKATPPANVAH
jgi:cobalt/nickel transport protein